MSKDKFGAPMKHWQSIPVQRATVTQFLQFKAEAGRIKALREQHAAFIQWAREP